MYTETCITERNLQQNSEYLASFNIENSLQNIQEALKTLSI